MALIKCAECGREISDQSSACPGCGAPTKTRPMTEKTDQEYPTLGIVALVLGLSSTIMPYFAAVFLVPAAFATGIIAFQRGQRKLGAITIILSILGVIGIISMSNQISSNDILEEKVTSVLDSRDNLVYLPQSDEPFSGRYEYYLHGQKTEETHYKDGIKNGLSKGWYENGQQSRELIYKNGKVNGVWIIWHENGLKMSEINYEDGEKVGLEQEWNQDGQITNRQTN